MPESIAFAGNARYGAGGQGEFLRQMALALGGRTGATIYARDPGPISNGVAVPRGRIARASLSAIRSVPLVRGRDDWTTLIDDRDFDGGVARLRPRASIFDGVAGQCALSAVAARRRGAAVVVSSLNTHADALAEVLDRERARAGASVLSFVHPAMRRRVRREVATADWVRVLSPRSADSFAARGFDPSRIAIVPPAIDLTYFQPLAVRDGTFRVMSVAAIDLRKGARYLLEAFTTAALPEAELEMIGGTGSRWARALMASYTRDHPNITLRSADVLRVPPAETYGRASVLVHAALEDGFGLVVAQALASGRPVIVTDATGASDLVTDGVNGFVVPAGSASAIRDKLQLLASDRDLLHRMSAQAPHAVAHLGYPAFCEAVLAFYRKVSSS